MPSFSLQFFSQVKAFAGMMISLVQKPVTIHDARADPQTYDECGFTLMDCTTEITDWDDEAQLEAYKKEVETMVKKVRKSPEYGTGGEAEG